MSAEAAAAAMAGAKVFGDYQYIGKRFGKYKCEVQALKFTEAGKPCFELKILESEKTQTADSLASLKHPSPLTAAEPYKAGEVVSHLEDLSNPKNGSAGRLLKALLATLSMTETDISTAQEDRGGKTVELEGENAKRKWLLKMMDQKKQPTAFMFVSVEIEPRPVPEKDGKPATCFSKEKWSAVEMTDSELDAIDAKREAAKLPKITDALT